MIPIPTHIAWDEEWGSHVFRFDEHAAHPMDGRYRVAGAVTWPIQQTGASGEQVSDGFALAAAENIQTGIVYVMLETPFIVVDPILRDDGGIEYAGLSQWFNEAWSRIGCSKYFWSGNAEAHRTYMLQVIRSKNIDPKPAFVELPPIPLEQAAHGLNALIETGRIKFNADQATYKALQVRESRPGTPIPPVLSSITLAAGLQRFIYRRPW